MQDGKQQRSREQIDSCIGLQLVGRSVAFVAFVAYKSQSRKPRGPATSND